MSLLGLGDYGSSSSDDSDNEPETTVECVKTEVEVPKTREVLANPFLTADSAVSAKPSFMQETEKIAGAKFDNSVFQNPFRDKEDKKTAVLEQHVEMTQREQTGRTIGGKKVCWNFRKGRCGSGHRCKFAHDNDIKNAVTEKLYTETKKYEQGSQISSDKANKGAVAPLSMDNGHSAIMFSEKDEPTEGDLVARKKRPGLVQGLVPVVAGTVLLTGGAVGGAVGYASIDSNFRQQLEETVPGSSNVTNFFLGDPVPDKPTLPQTPPSKLRKSVIITKPETPDNVSANIVPPPPRAQRPASVPHEASTVSAMPGADSKKGTKSDQEDTNTSNSEMESTLKKLCEKMDDSVSNAVIGYEVSTDAVVDHINLMKKVLDSNVSVKDETAWNEMFDAAVTKSDAIKAAEIKEREALAAIDKVAATIDMSQKNKSTEAAEKAVANAKQQIEDAKSKNKAVQKEASAMEDYRDLIEDGRQHFFKEMASIMPDVNLKEKGSQLSDEELNMFITHAYRKVLFLQQELAKQQTLEKERFKNALERSRADVGDQERQELELEHDRRMAAMREESENEIRAQLKRQAAAHYDHVTDALQLQKAELTRKSGQVLDEKLSTAEIKYQESLARLSGTVTGLFMALKERATADKSTVKSQNLWLACTAFYSNLVNGKHKADTWEGKFLPLKDNVLAVKNVAGEDDQFVEAVLASINPLALQRGVYTEDSLRERWTRVEKVANRVANIGEEGGCLMSFGLSYLQSLLLMDLSVRLPSEKEDNIDFTALSSIELVSLARHSLDSGNLARAVQYATQLKGEPARVVRDWLGEARLTLETKQAVEALLAHAQATSVLTLPSQ